jgi:hypothetical protein
MKQYGSRAVVLGGVVGALGAYVLAGDLNPPAGPVGETMKTLDEVEARIPVGPQTTPGDASNVYVISQPGSYYLTGNIIGEVGKNGIEINAENVTLDLNGFELRGVVGSFRGIRMADFRERVVVRNGSISDWGSDGAQLAIDSGIVENLRVGRNGSWGVNMNGVYAGRISDCTFIFNGSTASTNGGGLRTGTGAIVEDCSFVSNSGYGVEAGPFSVINECTVWGTTADAGAVQDGTGVWFNGAGGLIESSTSNNNQGVGIQASSGAILVRGCVANGNGGVNIQGAATTQVIDTVAP